MTFQSAFLVKATVCLSTPHDDVIKWKHFPRYWPLVRGIHRSTVNSSHKGQWRGALMFSFICVWINSWVNNRGAADLRRFCAHYDVIIMYRHTHKIRIDGEGLTVAFKLYLGMITRVGGVAVVPKLTLAMTMLSTTNQLFSPYLFHWQHFLWPKGVLW